MKLIFLGLRVSWAILLFAAFCHPIFAQSHATLSERLTTAIKYEEPSWKFVQPFRRRVSPEFAVQGVLEGAGYEIRVDLSAHLSDKEAEETVNHLNRLNGLTVTAVLKSPQRTVARAYRRRNVVVAIIADAYSGRNAAEPLNTANQPTATIIVDRVARIIDDLISNDVKADACVNELYADPRPEPASRLEAFFRDIEAGCLPRVQQALVDGVNANARDSQGTTPLMLAVTAGRRDITQTLLRSGADPHTVIGATGTAIFRVFSRRSAYRGADLRLILANQLAMLDDLVAAGANLEARNDYGRTFLLEVARMNYDDGSANLMLKGVIERGADVSARDREGRTAMIHAVMHTAPKVQVETLPVLLAAGVDVNAVDVFGKRAVDYANERADTLNAREWQTVLSLLTDSKDKP